MESKRLNITLKPDLLERMDNYVAENGMSRSALISIAVNQYLNAVQAMPSVQKIFSGLADIVEKTSKGQLQPNEAMQRLEGIQSTYKEIVKK